MRRNKKQVAVLGCGPAGIFAAQAAEREGYSVHIYSKKRRSDMFGAQFLHAPIPGLSDREHDPVRIDYELMGSVLGYKEKVYGGALDIEVSVSSLVGRHGAWDIRQAYYAGYEKFETRIENVHKITGTALLDFPFKDFRAVISTIPRIALCNLPEEHMFKSQSVWAIGDAPERGITCPVMTRNNAIICNGLREPSWYRASNVFGYQTCEWPMATKPPIGNVATVVKPISTNCNCWRERMFFAGRYGSWRKGVLSHHVYDDVKELLS